MNKIKFLLCFALLVSGVEGRGQIYIDSYKFAAAGQLLLDAYPTAEAAFSLRKLRDGYTGNCITIRRASNGDTTNIGFVDNYLDTATLKTFCSGTNCFVRRWYDQSGNGRDAVQTTDANQPTIATAGVIFYKNGTPSLDFDGTNDVLSIPNSTATFNFLHNQTGISTLLMLAHRDNDLNFRCMMGNTLASESNVGFVIASRSNNALQIFSNNSQSGQYLIANLTPNNSVDTTKSFISYFHSHQSNSTASDRSEIYINNGNAIKNNTYLSTPSNSNATTNLHIGGLQNGNYINGGFKEIIIWALDQRSNRTAIRDNANTFYSIY